MLLSISFTLGDPCAPPSPTQTPAHSHVQRISHQDQPILCYSIPWDAQTLSPLIKMERGRAPPMSAGQESLGHLHHVAWPQHSASAYTPSTMGAQRHHSPKLAHLPWAHSAANLGRTPCGAGLCAIPGGPCSIRTRVGTLCSTAADEGCCTGLRYSRKGGMGPPPQDGSIRLHPEPRGTC